MFVKRAGDARACFARVPILVGDAVTDLAKRASLELDWHASAAHVSLFLVRADLAEAVESGDESAGVAAKRLFSGADLTYAGVSNGAFLLARLSSPPAAATGAATAQRFSSASTFVLDGPIPDSRGQPGVELLYAFSGSRVCCAKVGSRATLERELGVSAAVHAASLAPTVVRMAALETVTRLGNIEPYAALMMPLYLMTVGAASLAMDAGVGAARDAFALNVALCAFAAIKAFHLAGLAHGDIKPSNLL